MDNNVGTTEATHDHSFLDPLGQRIRRPRTGFFYDAGLLLVAFAMVLLPVIYVALIGLAGWAVYYHASHHFVPIMSWGTRNWRVMLIKLFVYATPIVVGLIVVFFMLKPLLNRRRKPPQSLALNPAAEPVLFAFIEAVCRAVGAPIPRRVNLDCQLNAAAGFRRGFFSFLGNDLVLVIGLPLAGNLTVGELAGVLAHEFGHFAQGVGMRLSYLVDSVNQWFARVVFERDAWDVWLTEAAEQAEEWWQSFLFHIAQLGVGFSRLILHGLMLAGHGISCFMARQMEYDADLHEIRLSGSEVFERTTQKLAILSVALERSYQEMRVQWNTSRQLPDSVPAALRVAHQQLPAPLVAKVHGELGLKTSGLFATHPSPAERIRRARREAEAGIFHDDRPASVLFENFAVPASQVTLLHYVEDLGLPVAPELLVPITLTESQVTAATAIEPTPTREVFFGLGELVLPFNHAAGPDHADAADPRQTIAALDAQLSALAPRLEPLASEYWSNRAAWASAEASRRLRESGAPDDREDSSTASELRESIESTRRTLREVVQAINQRFELAAEISGTESKANDELATLAANYVRWREVADELAVIHELKQRSQREPSAQVTAELTRQLQRVEQLAAGISHPVDLPRNAPAARIRLTVGADATTLAITRLKTAAQEGMNDYVQRITHIWWSVQPDAG